MKTRYRERYIVAGEGGADSLDGTGGKHPRWCDGNDLLAGGPGADTLTGGLGDDVFVFHIGAGRVTITDFDPGPPGPGTIVDQIEFKAFGPALTFAALDTDTDRFIDASDSNVSGTGDVGDPPTLSSGPHNKLIIEGWSTLTVADVVFL